MILSDCYLSHSPADLQTLVEGGNLDEAVLARLQPRLDQGRHHGVWWFNRERVEVRYKDGGKTRKFDDNPREEWVAIPIPDLGVERGHVMETQNTEQPDPVERGQALLGALGRHLVLPVRT